MRLLRHREVEIGPSDRVFRHPRLLALIVWLAGFAGVAAMLFSAYTGKFKPGYIFGPFLLTIPIADSKVRYCTLSPLELAGAHQ